MMNKVTKRICCNQVSSRQLLFAFFVLIVLVVFDMFNTPSKRVIVADVMSKMRTTVDEISSSGSYQRTHSLPRELVGNYRRWLQLFDNSVLPTPADEQNEVVAKDKFFMNISGTANNETDGTRQDECLDCFKHDFNYIIDNPDICKLYSKDQVVKVVIMITTIHGHIQKRKTIRNTWLSPYINNTGDVRYAFVLGETPNIELHRMVKMESTQFKDILKEDFIDTYKNLTIKTIMAFKWTATKCAHAKYVLKTDDDMFINIPNLIRTTVKYSKALQSGIGGACFRIGRPNRRPKSKWFASFQSYPNSRYSAFCLGTGYVMSLEVARKVYIISPTVPFFHLEDVYVGLCLEKLKLKVSGLPGFHILPPPFKPCNYKNNKLVSAHFVPPS